MRETDIGSFTTWIGSTRDFFIKSHYHTNHPWLFDVDALQLKAIWTTYCCLEKINSKYSLLFDFNIAEISFLSPNPSNFVSLNVMVSLPLVLCLILRSGSFVALTELGSSQAPHPAPPSEDTWVAAFIDWSIRLAKSICLSCHDASKHSSALTLLEQLVTVADAATWWIKHLPVTGCCPIIDSPKPIRFNG